MTDAVKMAIEALDKCRAQFQFYANEHTSAGKLEKAATNQRFADMATAALEQAGEPVDIALLDRAELAWQRFFYPAADCFTGPTADKLPSVDLEVADCLRLILAAVGRLVVTPEADVSAPLPTLQRLGQEFDAGEADAWRVDDLTAKGEVCDSFVIFTDHEKVEDHVRKYGQRHTKVTPLYAHPPQSRVAAEPVGLREEESKLVATARRNIRTFISAASFKSENDRQAAIACVDVLEEHMNGLGDLVTVLRSAFGAASSLATPSQPDPQSRGQAFDGEGEAARIAGKIPISEFPGKSYADKLDNAAKVMAALSIAKRGEVG